MGPIHTSFAPLTVKVNRPDELPLIAAFGTVEPVAGHPCLAVLIPRTKAARLALAGAAARQGWIVERVEP